MDSLNISSIDLVLVLSYLIACLVLGLAKFDQIKNLRDYTLGARPFTTTVLIATTFSTAISAHKTIGAVGKVYSMGLIFALSMFLIPIGWFVMARLLSNNLKFFHQKKFLTLGEIMEHWYGKTGRWLTSICAVAFTLGITAAGSIAIGKLFNYFFGISETLAMIIALGIVTFYSVFGGIKAVAVTDVFQFLIFFVALPIACAIGYNDIGGHQNIYNSLPESHIQIEDWPLFLGMAGFALMPNADIPFIQRALVSSNTNQLKNTFNAVAILMYPLFIIVALMGLMAYIYNPNIDPDTSLYFFIQNYLPHGVIGLMISGILAIVMSTQDSFLNTTSTLIARDICKQLWPQINDNTELLIARLACILIAVMSVGLLFITDSILDLIWFVANFWDPLIIVPFIGCLIGIRVNKRHFFILPIAVLAGECATKFVTGVFDSRSFTVGIIVSAFTLFLISTSGYKDSSQKKKKPTKNQDLLFKVKHLIDMDSYEVAIAYKFSILTIFGFFISIFFNPLLGIPSQDSVFYLNSFGATLCIIFILGEVWLPNRSHVILSYLWFIILVFCIPFINSYTMVRSEFYVLWINNFVLATLLLYLMTNEHRMFLITWLVGTILGVCSAIVFNYYIPSQPRPPYPPFDYDFAIYTAIYLILVILLMIYNKFYAQKKMLLAVEQEVADRTKKLKESLGVKKEFLDNVSHEIKTPIHNITNIVNVLYENWDALSESKKKDLIGTLMSCNHRILNLCSNILDLSKFRKGDASLSFKKCNIVNLIEEIVNEYHHIQTPITTNAPENLRKIVDCDSDRILQVLRNLVDNAIKYGKGTAINISAVNYANNNIKITVSDSGPGIPEKEIDKIFEPFEQSSRTKTKAGGTGLGLAICRQIIEMHTGFIWVKNNKPGGTSIYFILPIEH